MSTSEDVLVPYTEILRQECPRHVAWMEESPIAKSSYQSGAGKSALINAVFGVEGATPVYRRTSGVHDIEKPFSFPQSDPITIHDSQGFEPGEEGNIQTVSDFIHRRSNMPALADQLHEIWICAEIPFAGGRLFERCRKNFVGISGKFADYWDRLEKQLERRGQEMDDDEFEAALDAMVISTVQNLCVKRPYALGTPEMGCNIDATVQCSSKYQWLDSVTRFPASVGRKRYWRGLISDIFLGFTMRSVLEVLQKDIVNHLQKPEFLALLSVLVEDMSDEGINNYPLTEKAVQAIIENPAAIVITGPTAVVVLFAEWVQGTYKKTKSSVRCPVAFIVDLMLTMDTLFYLVLSRGQIPIKIALVNSALRIYNSRKAPVHTSIKAWVDGWGAFGHLDADVVIKKITGIIADNSVKPEQWAMRDEGLDESWIPMEALRGP
ncbi:hypothetical protein C8R45DRAFT_1112244 [Mycena sanguinolenta]|nr:hypothetical protein C8R45DRAFT_1112244 [Mycena sanguinolenta]